MRREGGFRAIRQEVQAEVYHLPGHEGLNRRKSIRPNPECLHRYHLRRQVPHRMGGQSAARRLHVVQHDRHRRGHVSQQNPDLEPTVFDNISTGTYRQLYHPE
uniref:(northern house mosquito) hypothetical protein n=1 Tax=Culex pipiens TaxID=7175 RepID=A0A8D8IKW5_CULPI